MKTLYILDYTAELIELTYELGTLTRKHVVPALVAIYVATVMAYEFVTGRNGPTRAQMIQKLTREWKSIVSMDLEGDPSESLEFVWYLDSLSDEELVAEYKGL